jgi:hypothetical protein
MFIPSHMIWELYNQEQQHQSQMKARTQSASPVAIGYYLLIRIRQALSAAPSSDCCALYEIGACCPT